MIGHRRTILSVLASALLLFSLVLVTRLNIGSARAAAAVQVAIQNFAFSPSTLQVAPGTTVTWTNRDQAPHTVTSDSNAWADSGTLNTGQSFSHTFTVAGTYAYHCTVHPTMTATVVVGVAAAGPTSTPAGSRGMNSMGPMSTMPLHVFTGYYDGERVHYLSTDTSSKAEALRDHLNYAPSLAKALATTNPIYLIVNGPYAARGPVFGAGVSDPSYSPLWQEVQVTWKDTAGAVPLGRDDQIKKLAKAGKLTIKATTTVLNCPIVAAMPGM